MKYFNRFLEGACYFFDNLSMGFDYCFAYGFSGADVRSFNSLGKSLENCFFAKRKQRGDGKGCSHSHNSAKTIMVRRDGKPLLVPLCLKPENMTLRQFLLSLKVPAAEVSRALKKHRL
jgi:hypothetical protein